MNPENRATVLLSTVALTKLLLLRAGVEIVAVVFNPKTYTVEFHLRGDSLPPAGRGQESTRLSLIDLMAPEIVL